MGRSGDPRRRVGAHAFVGLGARVEATPSRQQQARVQMITEDDIARASGQHYWCALAQFRLTDAAAATVVGQSEGSPILDTENLRNIHVVCMVCEQPVAPDLIGGVCPGDPAGHAPFGGQR